MKRKSQKATEFINDLHKKIISDVNYRKDTKGKSEVTIQREIRPLIIKFLIDYFRDKGYRDSEAKANQSFYWEGQERKFSTHKKLAMFSARNYPDFIINEPYNIALEFKQSDNGSLMKQGIGQSILHTMSEEYDFVYLLFHDQSKDKKIKKSMGNELEKKITEKVWNDFNVMVKIA